MLTPQLVLGLSSKLVVDIFAGGGGWSTAYEQATGQHVHIAINHNPDALSMHAANHPQTRHYIADVWEVDPHEATDGRPVGWLHLSPDCTDHSQAKGGQPRSQKIRSLAWVGVRWAGQARPDVISLENVIQMKKWGRLIAKRDPVTNRVIKLSGGVAAPGERVPVQDQYLIPDPKDQGRHWRRLLAIWRSMGYVVEYRALRASDYGAGTKRTRLFAIGRRDGQPIVWPEPTHSAKPKPGQKRLIVAADGIDFSIQGKSIFDRPRPLAEATMQRIARGMKRYVLDSADPFIVPIANWSRDCSHSTRQPISTITAKPRGGSHAVVAPVLAGVGGRAGQSEPRPASDPHYTITRKGDSAVIAPVLLQANGGFNTTPAHDARRPASTITNTGSQQQLVTAYLTTPRCHNVGADAGDPLPTAAIVGQHHGLVEYSLSSEDETGALLVAAFLMRYYGQGGQWDDLRDPASTLTTRDRLALVTVHLRGVPYVIVDICLRMLTPRELYRLQGFPDSYIIDRGHDGRIFSKSAQVHMAGNSVSPPPAIALIAANAPRELLMRKAA